MLSNLNKLHLELRLNLVIHDSTHENNVLIHLDVTLVLEDVDDANDHGVHIVNIVDPKPIAGPGESTLVGQLLGLRHDYDLGVGFVLRDHSRDSAYVSN